jgi:hypothetical protein
MSGVLTCKKRLVADVSAVADPATPVAVYDSFGSTGSSNWYLFGGTSVSAPIIAGLYARAWNVATIDPLAYPYDHPAGLNDVLTGSNGHCPGNVTPLCTARTGWDGPTGLGTPNGLSAF